MLYIMKKTILLSAISCLLILGCKNNQTAQNNENPADTANVTAVQNVEPQKEAYVMPKITEPVAFQVWKLLVNDGKEYVCPEDCTLSYFAGDLSEAEGYMIEESVYCYPKKDGSFLAVLQHIEAAEGQGGEYEYSFYNYKDGAVSKIENDMPVPEFLDLVVDPEERRGQDDVLARLESLYKENPRGILEYIFSPEDGIVKIQLHPLSYGEYIEPDENGKYKWLEQFWEMRKDSDANVYRWNGEKFVKEQQ